MKTKVDLHTARGIAGEILTYFSTYCARMEVAGSIRRGRKQVGDIEIVVSPKGYTQQGLFGDVEEHSFLETFHWDLLGKVIKNGPRMK